MIRDEEEEEVEAAAAGAAEVAMVSLNNKYTGPNGAWAALYPSIYPFMLVLFIRFCLQIMKIIIIMVPLAICRSCHGNKTRRKNWRTIENWDVLLNQILMLHPTTHCHCSSSRLISSCAICSFRSFPDKFSGFRQVVANTMKWVVRWLLRGEDV